MRVTAVRYNGTVHDFAMLNPLRDTPATRGAVQQAITALRGAVHVDPDRLAPPVSDAMQRPRLRRGVLRPPKTLHRQEFTMLKSFLAVTLAGTSLFAGAAKPLADGSADTIVRNIVLVHGAYADGSSYAGHPAAQGSGAARHGRPESADVARGRCRGHEACDRTAGGAGDSRRPLVRGRRDHGGGNDPRVAGLVYISAIAPDDGQSASDALAGYPATPGGAEQHPDAAGYLTITRKGVDEDFVPDLRPPSARWSTRRRATGTRAS